MRKARQVRRRIGVIILVVVLTISIVYYFLGTTPISDPAAAVRGLYAALYTHEGNPADFVCATAPDFVTALEDSIEASNAAFDNATINISGLAYNVMNQDASSATVIVQGQIIYTISGRDTPVRIATNHTLVAENREWKVCG